MGKNPQEGQSKVIKSEVKPSKREYSWNSKTNLAKAQKAKL